MRKFIKSYNVNQFETKIVNGKIEVWEKDESAEKWVDKILSRFFSEGDCAHFCIQNYTFVVSRGNIATARCAKDDTFSEKIGIAIAYARLKGLPIHPDFFAKENRKGKENLRIQSRGHC